MAKQNVFGPGDEGADFSFMRMCNIDRIYIQSFKRAADIVVNAVPTGETTGDDDLLFSVGYLYRHALELQLKYIIRLGVEMKLLETSPECLDAHALYPLWNKARDVLSDESEVKKLGPLENVIQQLHDVDPSGQEFRFERTTMNKPSLNLLPDLVSLTAMQRVVTKVYDQLETCTESLEAQWDARNHTY